MKAMIIILTGPMMLFFTVSVFSTIEYCVENGLKVLWWYVGLICALDIIWCVAAGKCNRHSLNNALKRYEKFLDSLFINKYRA